MSKQTSVTQLINEQNGVTTRRVVVMFEKTTGTIILIDASDEQTFSRGAIVNNNYIVVAFTVPVEDLEGKSGRPSKVQKIKGRGVQEFFKRYKLTKF